MSDTYELKAEARERVGKGSARELRRNGRIPAVIYGDKQEPLPISVSYKDIYMKLHAGGFMTTIATIDTGKEKIRVLPKDYQLDPVRDFPMHVDFLRITAKSIVTVEIPVHFINEEECEGISRGGVLNVVRHTVEVHCPATAIPEFFEADLAGLDIGDGIHISNIKLPEGVTPTITDRDFTIATIATPAAVRSESDEEEEAGAEAAEAADEDGETEEDAGEEEGGEE